MSSSKTIESRVDKKLVRSRDLLELQKLQAQNRSIGQGISYDNDVVEIVGPIAEIVACSGVAGAYACFARPVDVADCTIQYIAGNGWVGCLGVFDTYSQLALCPVGALVQGKITAKVGTSVSYQKYIYMSSGWVLESSIGVTGQSNLPGSPSNPFTTVDERTAWTTANLATLLPGRTTAWYLLDDGVTAVEAMYTHAGFEPITLQSPRYGTGNNKHTNTEFALATAKNRIAFWGSSTFASSSSDTTCADLRFDGIITALVTQTACGPALQPVYNGAVAGAASSDILAKFLAEVDSYSYDIGLVQLGANDLVNSSNGATICDYATQVISALISRGKTAVLVCPYSRRLGESNDGRNIYSAWLKSAKRRYGNHLCVIDLFEALSKPYTDQMTPEIFMGDVAHLNSVGTTASVPELSRDLTELFGIFTPDSICVAGVKVLDYANAETITTLNVTRTLNSSVDAFGRKSYRIATTTPGTEGVFYTTANLVPGKKYALVSDVKVVSGTGRFGVYARSQDYSTTYFRGSQSQSFPISYQPGLRRRYLLTFTASAAMAANATFGLRLTDAIVDISDLALIRLD